MIRNNSIYEIQAFIITMRWIIVGLIPVLASVSRRWYYSYDAWGVAIFGITTVMLTFGHLRRIAINIKSYEWGLIHLADLLAISLMVLGRGGIASECFNLYYLVILQAGLIFGFKQALACLFRSSVLYTASILLTTPAEGDIRKLLIRVIYSWLVGIMGTYLVYVQKKHQAQAVTDYVTSTYNRSFLEQSLDYEFNRAVTERSNLSVVMIDIDNFKVVNDRHGHRVGDRVLEKVAAIIKTNIREVDFVARYGGEEFIVTLPGIGSDKAWEVAERIRHAVEKEQIGGVGEAGVIKVTVSCGIASYPVQAANLVDLMQMADDYLYEAKRNGRNRVCSTAG